MDMNLSKLLGTVKDRGDCHAVAYRVPKSQIWLSTEQQWKDILKVIRIHYWSDYCKDEVGEVKWKSLSRIRLFVMPWAIQSMEFSRPEYWSA